MQHTTQSTQQPFGARENIAPAPGGVRTEDFAAGAALAGKFGSASAHSVSSLWRLLVAELNLSKISITLVLITSSLVGMMVLSAWLGILALVGVLLVTSAGWSLAATILTLIVAQLMIIFGLVYALKGFIDSIGIPKTERLIKIVLSES
ncbi:hypothetical protein [Halioxenophilus aromaticivorans]|uniref:Phage holin family protein n=1 Tax=Halioxenophilus aromaticivorans TaxID=1306992 RepID=A0AAV3U936_9ALTE